MTEEDEAFSIFWEAGMRKVGKKNALSKFKPAYKKWEKDPEWDIIDFAQMLRYDIGERITLNQFGFDGLHPATYLYGERWNDAIPEIKNDLAQMPIKEEGFISRHTNRAWREGL